MTPEYLRTTLRYQNQTKIFVVFFAIKKIIIYKMPFYYRL